MFLSFLVHKAMITYKGAEKLRCTQNLTRRSIAAIYRAVYYYLKQLAKQDPELVNYYLEHIVIGKQCYWSEEPIRKIGKTIVA